MARSYEGLADADVVTTTRGSRTVGMRCYAVTGDTVSVEILSMSHGTYGLWRGLLCLSQHGIRAERLWADKSLHEVAFADVINFTDRAGCIGPVAAARLLGDFEAPAARDRFGQRGIRGLNADLARWCGQAWDGWAAGLRLAADDGMVRFA